MSRTLRCYAEGRDGDWEAICLDLDIAVQGGAFDDVLNSLRQAIALYLETVADLPRSEQFHLLGRRAPLAVGVQVVAQALRPFVSHDHRRQGHRFGIPLVGSDET